MAKVVVTGGCGFIGSHLALMLAEDNDVVVFGKSSLPSYLSGKVEFVKGDIRNLAAVCDAFSGADTVYHLAAQARDSVSFSDTYHDFCVNALGSINVAEACVKNNVKNLVFFSTATVYGNNPDVPFSENAETMPLSPYAMNKQFVEKYIMFFKKNTTIARVFNVYGLRPDRSNPDSNVISRCINMAKREQDITIFGDGKQTRDFVHVSDVCRAVITVCGHSGIFNIGTGKATSINEVAMIVNKLYGEKSKIIHVDEKEGDIKHSCADISKLRSLGWVPEVCLEERIKGMIE